MSIDAIEISKKLISCASVTPDDNGVLKTLEDAIKPYGFTCETYVFSDNNTPSVKNLFAKFGHGSKHFCFAGHSDVVPAGDELLWLVPPFAPQIINGNLIGRGTSDMKCAIACFAAASSKFISNNKNFGGSISMLITGDEEGIAINGTKKLLEQLTKQGEKFSHCLVGEPSSAEKLGDTIKIGRRGSVTFEIIVMGKQGHVAYPHLADNPVPRLTKFLHTLASHKLDDGNEFFQSSNLEIVNIEVNNKADNVIPAMAKARFNIRFNDTHDSHSLIKWVQSLINSLFEDNSAKFELKYHVSGESFITKPNDFSRLVQGAIEKETGIGAVLSTSGGTSDARFIKDYCPVLEFGMLNKTAHQIDEQVSVADINKLADIYYRILCDYFGA